MAINNTLDLTCEHNGCSVLYETVGGCANCFSVLVSSTAKLHSAEPRTWPAHESELDNRTPKYANIHLTVWQKYKRAEHGWRLLERKKRTNGKVNVKPSVTGEVAEEQGK